jgi:pyrroline-5-carboxylate reductase
VKQFAGPVRFYGGKMSRSKRIGFIGCGSMGSAMLKGILKAHIVDPDEVIVSCKSEETGKRIRETFAADVTHDNKNVVEESDMLFIAVKPYQFPEIASEIKEVLSEDQIIISVIAGMSVDALQEKLGSAHLQIMRAMPNTPAAVGEAMTALVPGSFMTEQNIAYTKRIFESFGRAEIVPENLMDTVTGVSGSSPAYIYMLIEAMADEAVKQGMTRKSAYIFAAQTVLGSAKMVLETGMHPGELKDAVTSPGGTTIEGLSVLEDGGFRGLVMEGIDAAIEKSRSM